MSVVRLVGCERILLGGPEWDEAAGDVLIRDGRIAAIGGDLAGEAGAGARTVDAAGLTAEEREQVSGILSHGLTGYTYLEE